MTLAEGPAVNTNFRPRKVNERRDYLGCRSSLRRICVLDAISVGWRVRVRGGWPGYMHLELL